MDASKLTSRSVEVINAASTLAVNEGNPQVEPVHLAVALLRQEQGITPSLLAKCGADVAEVSRALDQALWNLPNASGSTVSTPGASAALTRVLARSLDLIKDMGDDYVATEHLLLALTVVDTPVKTLLAEHAVTESCAARGRPGRARQPQGHQPGGGGDLRGPREVRRRPDRARRGGPARPGHRPRRRDPSRRAGALAAYQEQPGADRRARRRQDRRRRGTGAARGRGRRARLPQGQAGAQPRPGGDGRRREVPRRVRGAAQGRPRGDQGRRGPDHHLHRRAAHGRRRGRRRRLRDGRRQHAQADAGPR